MTALSFRLATAIALGLSLAPKAAGIAIPDRTKAAPPASGRSSATCTVFDGNTTAEITWISAGAYGCGFLRDNLLKQCNYQDAMELYGQCHCSSDSIDSPWNSGPAYNTSFSLHMQRQDMDKCLRDSIYLTTGLTGVLCLVIPGGAEVETGGKRV